MVLCFFLTDLEILDKKKNSNYKVTDNFLTSNCYMCIELNAHNLIKLVKNFQELPDYQPEMFVLADCSSQNCEKLFRSARSLSSTFSTVINFSTKDFI